MPSSTSSVGAALRRAPICAEGFHGTASDAKPPAARRPPEIIDLLVLGATEGCSQEQQSRLQTLLKENGLDDMPDFDLAAAAAGNAFGLKTARDSEEAPDGLKAKLLSDAEEFFGQQRETVVEFKPAQTTQVRWRWGWATAAVLAIM